MSRRVNLIMLLGLVVVLVLSFGVSAGIAQEQGDAQSAAPPPEGDAPQAVETTELEAAQEELAGLRQEAEIANSVYRSADYELNQLNLAVTDAVLEHADAQDNLQGAQEELGEQASRLYKNPLAFLDVLVGAKSFRDFANRLGLWIQLLEGMVTDIADWRGRVDELKQIEVDLKAQVEEQQQTTQEAAALRDEADSKVTAVEDYVGSLDANLQEAIQNEEAQKRESRVAESQDLLSELAETQPALLIPSQIVETAEAEPSLDPMGAEQGPIVPGVSEEDRAEIEDASLATQQAAREAEELREAANKAAEEAANLASANMAAPSTAEAVDAEKKAVEDKAATDAANKAAAEKAAADAANKAAADKAAIDAANKAAAARDAEKKAVEDKAAKDAANKAAAERAAAADAANKAAADKAVPSNSANKAPSPAGADNNAAINAAREAAAKKAEADRAAENAANEAARLGNAMQQASGQAAGASPTPATQGQPKAATPTQGQPKAATPTGQPAPQAVPVPGSPVGAAAAPTQGQPKAATPTPGQPKEGQPAPQPAPAPGSASGAAATGVGMGLVGKPYAFGTEGPDTFSCTGLIRYIARTIGLSEIPSWDHMAWLSQYPTVSEPAPGDLVVYPDGGAMYLGGGNVLMANEADQIVGVYPMDAVGTPVGFARPY